MKLYKFRSLHNLAFVLDILINERLHSATYDQLNDPFEGLLTEVRRGGDKGAVQSGGTAKGAVQPAIRVPQMLSAIGISPDLRICSLSATLEDVRLWSHYADGHNGVAIEIEIPECLDEFYQVDYVEGLRQVESQMFSAIDPTDILKTKTKHWEYECEYRLITEKEHFPIEGKLTGVFLGARHKPDDLSHELQLLLKLIPSSIPVFTTKLNYDEVVVAPDERLS